MKYSELKSYLELARWENESDNYYTKVYRNGYTVAEVGLWEQYNIRILDPTQMTEGLYRRLSDFAKTPLAEREEEKKYYLLYDVPPLLRAVHAKPRYLYRRIYDGYIDTSFSQTNDSMFKTIFTESEIEQMDITGFVKVEVTT